MKISFAQMVVRFITDDLKDHELGKGIVTSQHHIPELYSIRLKVLNAHQREEKMARPARKNSV
jgi:hypothetical protein